MYSSRAVCIFNIFLFALLTCHVFSTSLQEPTIGGGELAKIEQFPWQVALISIGSNCGGFLISSRFVMTAAHCVNGKSGVPVVRLGTENRENRLIEETVQRIFIHPDYKEKSAGARGYPNDIALLLLEQRVKYSPKVKPIKLPSKKIQDLHRYPAMASGFGRDVQGLFKCLFLVSTKFNEFLCGYNVFHTSVDEHSKGILFYINMTILQDAACKKAYSHYNSSIHICAMGKDGLHQFTCKGDSGGALAINYHNQIKAVGIVSFGVDGCSSRPKFFARIDTHLQWIHKIIKIYP